MYASLLRSVKYEHGNVRQWVVLRSKAADHAARNGHSIAGIKSQRVV